MKISSDDKRIEDLLKGNRFLIPRFQREYSWEPDQVLTFWNDVNENKGESYFIGAMVVYKEGNLFAIVDGQQRLTTITIFLCAIRDAFARLGADDLASGLQEYIEKRDKEYKTVYVLKTETSYPFLQEKILKATEPEMELKIGREEEAISQAFAIFEENIARSVERFFDNKEQTRDANTIDAVRWLSGLRDAVLELSVILVSLENEDDAYLIFETLNTRGKDLALVDLLRNHFSKHLKPNSEVDQTKHKWREILDTISSSPVRLDPDQFVVHSWQSRYDFVGKAKVFSKVKELINETNAKGHLDRLVSDAAQWRSMFDTQFGWNKDEKSAARSLAALRVFRVVQPAPGLLSLVRAYRDGIIKYKTLRNALSAIEKFHFSFNAVTSSRSSGGISGMYSSFGRQVFSAKDSNQVGIAIGDLIAKLREREVPEAEFDVGFQQIIFTNLYASEKSLVQYILRKIAKAEAQPFLGDSEDLTIEHLLPQSSSKSDDDEHVIGQLGNLFLVDSETNGLLADKGFAEKKEVLVGRGYKLPPLLSEAETISRDLIEENTRRLSELARSSVWKV
ncbi:DUF262 domain-containing protein [Wenxinia marina]|uniref:DUF262 domain-containing protein n=1 Tax=Wenxinia marina DSM 24838 TaxID=1123501 RepID=A0A0D0NQL1_9RHOB|nr:DUF262 domain-containing protein [Wenxinia marina]KIQ70555.1 hypothetical protein Wenmar_00932 [Wenxinia marina DSM 24838]GGL52187.1 hypothetical protein GCM10011392_03170 [Wenxinia marina]